MHRFWLLFVVVSLFMPAATPAHAETPVIWQGEIDGVPTWITVVPRGHEISAQTMETEPWWAWGNTSSDAYIFAFQDPGNVRLIVSFDQDRTGQPTARLYAAGHDTPPLEFDLRNNGLRILSNNGFPFVTVSPRSGGWLVDGAANYNLELSYDGLYVEGFGYRGAQTDGVVDVKTTVGGNVPGTPDWEVTRLEYDPRPNDAYPRLGILQRTENAPPFEVIPPAMPGFPYLGISGNRVNWFISNPNPLLFDLQTMNLRTNPFPGFQNGGMYNVNSISFDPHINFEAPFVFYNFDPDNRFAHLVVRGVYSPAEAALGIALPSPRLGIRYSWKTDDVERWRYGLQLSDFYVFEDRVQVGDTEIIAVEAEQFPKWVTSKPWRATTFIEAVSGYSGSEGIYHYLVDNEDWQWIAGGTSNSSGHIEAPLLQESTELTRFTWRTLPAGFRGEYMFAHNKPPELYFSPVDGMLHLTGAEGGIWHLGQGVLLRSTDLDGNGLLDAWMREIAPPELDKETGLQRALPGRVIDSLFEISGYLLQSSGESVTIVQSNHSRVEFTISPPTDKESWEFFRAQLRPYENQRRDPSDLRSWLDAFPGPRGEIAGASVANVRLTDDGFRFELALAPGYQVNGPDLLGVAGLTPGKYVVESRDGAFMVTPQTPAQLSLAVRQATVGGAPPPLQITVANSGGADMRDLTLVVETQDASGKPVELARTTVQALAGQSTQVRVDLPSTLATGATLRVRQEDSQGQVVARGEWAPLAGSSTPPRAAIASLNQVPILAPVAVLFAVFVGMGAALALRRLPGESTR